MAKGDIVLIPFPFTDLKGNKLRPALILFENKSDITVSFITTRIHSGDPTDILLLPNLFNGIKKPSLLKLNKIATLDRSLCIGKIGSIEQSLHPEINQKLKLLFQIS